MELVFSLYERTHATIKSKGVMMEVKILKDEEYRIELLKAIRGAVREILILTFKCDFTGRTSKPNINTLVYALSTAASRAVKVKYLVNNSRGMDRLKQINRDSAGKMKELGIQIRYGPRARTYHSKLIVIDEVLAFVGSHNLSETSLSRNLEISVVIKAVILAQELRQIFLKEWNKSKENP